MKYATSMFIALAFLARAAFAVTMASQPWTKNRIAEAEARLSAQISAATNGISPDAALDAFAATGSVARATVYGTSTHWTDATGVVWQVERRLVGDLYMAGDREFESKVGPIAFSDSRYVVQKGHGFELWLDDYGEVQGYPMSQLAGHDGWWKEDRSYGTFFFSPSYALVTNIVGRVAFTNDVPDVSGYVTQADVTEAIREQSLGGIWDDALQVWWTPRMRNGSLTYEATTNVNLNAEN